MDVFSALQWLWAALVLPIYGLWRALGEHRVSVAERYQTKEDAGKHVQALHRRMDDMQQRQKDDHGEVMQELRYIRGRLDRYDTGGN